MEKHKQRKRLTQLTQPHHQKQTRTKWNPGKQRRKNTENATTPSEQPMQLYPANTLKTNLPGYNGQTEMQTGYKS